MTTKVTWKRRIREACKEAGTYEPHFDYAIDTLAGIMETRDKAEKHFRESGSKPVIEYTNKSGATNIVKNPALVAINDCNTQALAYWRDLGLTPAGLKRIRGEDMSVKKESKLATALRSLENEQT